MGANAAGDLSEYDITYLFVDGIAERLRPGGKREPVMAAWGFTDRGPSRAAAHDDRLERRCRDGDGLFRGYEAAWANRSAACDLGWGAVIIKAMEICFPRAVRQRCLAHRMRNLAAKVAGVHAPSGLSGTEPRDRARACGGDRRRLQPRAGAWCCLLHGRLRILHRPPTLPDEALIRAAERWRSVKVSEFERRQLAAVKKE
jgi:putative transposase